MKKLVQWIRDKLAGASEATRAQIALAAGWLARVGTVAVMTVLATRGWITGDDVQAAAGIAVGAVTCLISYLATRKQKKQVQALKEEVKVQASLPSVGQEVELAALRARLLELGEDPDAIAAGAKFPPPLPPPDGAA